MKFEVAELHIKCAEDVDNAIALNVPTCHDESPDLWSVAHGHQVFF